MQQAANEVFGDDDDARFPFCLVLGWLPTTASAEFQTLQAQDRRL